MNIFAIDPGVSGALVCYHRATQSVSWRLTPTIEVGVKGTKRVNAMEVARWFKSFERHTSDFCFIEKVGAMPGQGVSSMFSFGHSAGVVEGVVTALGLPVQLVSPQAWKKHWGLIGQDKDAARVLCVDLYPDLSELKLKGKGQAISDAILIAKFGESLLSTA